MHENGLECWIVWKFRKFDSSAIRRETFWQGLHVKANKVFQKSIFLLNGTLSRDQPKCKKNASTAARV